MLKMMRIAFLALAVTLLGIGGAQAQGILTAADYAEINQLYASYNLALDAGDAEAWADVFTEDGVFGNSEGRAGLVEFATGFHGQQQGNARHWNANVHVTATADGAEGTCYLMLWNVGTRPASLIVSGIYHDTLAKTAKGWRFTSRRVEADGPAQSDR